MLNGFMLKTLLKSIMVLERLGSGETLPLHQAFMEVLDENY